MCVNNNKKTRYRKKYFKSIDKLAYRSYLTVVKLCIVQKNAVTFFVKLANNRKYRVKTKKCV